MVLSAEVVGAIAASVAAVLSGVTLWVSSRRDELKWRRDSLVEVVVQFLDASFNFPDTVAFRTRASGGELDSVSAQTKEAHDQLVSALTRLRVLASDATVQKAKDLHAIEDRVVDIVLSGNDEDFVTHEEWSALILERAAARTALLDVSRQSLGLGKARSVELARPRPPGI